MASVERTIGRLEAEVKGLAKEMKDHREFEKAVHGKIDTDFASLHEKLDHMNRWKGKLILGAFAVMIVMATSTAPASQIIAKVAKKYLGIE